MKIKFSLSKACYSGETIGTNVTVYLRQCFSYEDIIECIKHEELHAILNEIAQTTSRQDHYIMIRLDNKIF